ncbi:NAD(P)-binding domain-containing protein [Lysobacter cavernae]|uniref:NAD(P)-binding domain-containing protein n=1 Tax=Lysobacter cavernae TaxID=1685901 RepID=A0ABV7RM25_9GAMM
MTQITTEQVTTEQVTVKQVTVIGLGQMGSTLAQLLLDSGYRVTVWNRTEAKADALVAGIGPTFADFLKYEGEVIQSGDFTVGESPLSISVEATECIARAARESGINDEFPVFAADLFQRAGYADQELAAMIKLLRGEAGAGTATAQAA